MQYNWQYASQTDQPPLSVTIEWFQSWKHTCRFFFLLNFGCCGVFSTYFHRALTNPMLWEMDKLVFHTHIRNINDLQRKRPTRRNALSAAANAWLTKPFLNWDLNSTNWLINKKFSHRGNIRLANSCNKMT